MSFLADARSNEFQGALDQIGGQSITDARTASATINAVNGEVAMDLVGKATAMFDLRGTTSATYVFEGSLDGANYYGLAGVLLAGTINGATVTQQDASNLVLSGVNACLVEVQCAGFRRIRARCTSFTSGSCVVTARASAAPFQLGVPSLDTAEAVMNLVSSQVFIDTFDASFDTTNNWNTPTTGNAGVAFAFSGASITGGTGTTANGFSYTTTRNSFQPGNPGYLEVQHNIGIPDGAAPTANSYRFWGLATIPATPTTAAPLTNALGFEITTAGKMVVVCYQSGARAVIQDLSAATGNGRQPLDGNAHKYYMWIRGDIGFFAIDGRDKTHVVATFLTGALGPDVTTLPIALLCVGGPTPPVSNSQLVDNMSCVGDTAQSNITISDGQFPFRLATIKAASTPAAATDGSLVVALHPSSPDSGRVATSNPTNASNAAAAPMMVDKAGRLVVTPTHTRDLIAKQVTLIAAASVAETTIITAGGAGVFNDLIGFVVSTTNAAVATLILRDGTGQASPFTQSFNYPATAAVPLAPLVITFPVPVPQAAANANWTMQASANANGITILALFAKNL